MSDHDDEPTDLFDAVCRLDDLAEWLTAAGYPEEAAQVTATSWTLKGFITISLAGDATPEEPA